ncbi:MAG: FHA domain-containing protein [Candidatus Lernaella stagnicola]|nr:FHA domain-containing protein [Candidatus Lernaella stagnicola]
MYKLEVRRDDKNPMTFLLREGTHSIGRNPENDVVLIDASVSRTHCLLYIKPNYVEVEDLGSANGVIVNGERVSSRVEITMDQEFRIGELRVFLRPGDFQATAETTIFHRDDLEE